MRGVVLAKTQSSGRLRALEIRLRRLTVTTSTVDRFLALADVINDYTLFDPWGGVTTFKLGGILIGRLHESSFHTMVLAMLFPPTCTPGMRFLVDRRVGAIGAARDLLPRSTESRATSSVSFRNPSRQVIHCTRVDLLFDIAYSSGNPSNPCLDAHSTNKWPLGDNWYTLVG